MPDFIPPTATFARFSLPRSHTIPADAARALAFAADCDRQADLLLSVGRTAQAEAAAHFATEVRARAQAVRP